MSNCARLIAVATVLLAIAFACLAPPKKPHPDESEPSTLSLRLKKAPAVRDQDRSPSTLDTHQSQPRSVRNGNPLRPKPYPKSDQTSPLDAEDEHNLLSDRYEPIITEALKVPAASKSTITIKVEEPSHDANTQVTKVQAKWRRDESATGFVTGNRVEVLNGSSNENLVEKKEDKTSARPGRKFTSSNQTTKERTNHKVRDGDTLQSIATRYLGSESRYLEIYDLNRDILIAPDILPIGLELRIPQASNSSIESKIRQREPKLKNADLRKVKIDTSILPISRDDLRGKPP